MPHDYGKPCYEYIKKSFPNVSFTMTWGNSLETLPVFNPLKLYDLVHVDGGHSVECIRSDLKEACRIVAPLGYIIVDDTNMPHINHEVNLLLKQNTFKEIMLLPTKVKTHRIVQKLETI